MRAIARTATSVPWWKEPTKEKWYAYIAAWDWHGWRMARRCIARHGNLANAVSFFASIFNFITSRRNVPMIRVDSAVITPGAGTVTA